MCVYSRKMSSIAHSMVSGIKKAIKIIEVENATVFLNAVAMLSQRDIFDVCSFK